MCGIAGIMMRGGQVPEPLVLDKLEESLLHRGPDGNGRYAKGAVGLLQTRLAIVDLKTGDQPFIGPDGTVLIANGEIYNDVEIRTTLPDAPYKSKSDCESPLHLYYRKGLDFADDLRGMYAIAIYNPSTSQLILTRDPFGIKPLYYIETPNYVAFASEPQALIAAGLAAGFVNPQQRCELLQLKFTTGSETIFSTIQRVLPGETIIIHDGCIVEKKRKSALPQSKSAKVNHTQTLQKLDSLFMETVTQHVRADVPYGLFLSSGIDSSALIAAMQRISSKPVIALTAAFSGRNAVDESAQARKIAQAVNAEHHIVEVREEDFWNYMPRLAQALDDPTTDAAALPTFMLAKTARQHLKVVLSGEGADEVFGGYTRYRHTNWLWRLFKKKSRTRGVFKLAGDHPAFKHWREGLSRTEASISNPLWTHMQRLQAIDSAEWLPNDLLTKLDRCLMAHSVEGRTPYLDPVLADFAFSLPDHMKVRGNFGKWILRDWVEKHIPAAEPWAKKKGFNPPIGSWIDNRKEELEKLVLSQPGIAEIAVNDVVRQVFAEPARNSQAAWSLVFYALWHSYHVLGVDPNGSIGDVLATSARLG